MFPTSNRDGDEGFKAGGSQGGKGGKIGASKDGNSGSANTTAQKRTWCSTLRGVYLF